MLSARVVTQCAWSLSVCRSLPWSASHTRIVRSLEAEYNTPFPAHLTTFTDAVCPPRVYSFRLVDEFQTRTVQSLEEEARRGEEAFLCEC